MIKDSNGRAKNGREPDHYAVLGVTIGSQDVVIEAAYRALMQKYDPDVAPSVNAAKKRTDIKAAYAILGNSKSRAAYDKRRGVHPPEAGAQNLERDESALSPAASQTGGAKKKSQDAAPSSVSSGVQKAAWITGGIIALIVIASGLDTPPNSGATDSVMNVDENLTTTDMNVADAADVALNEAGAAADESTTNNRVEDPSRGVESVDNQSAVSDDEDIGKPPPIQPTRATAETDIRSIFSADDYPAAAAAAGAEGIAQAALMVGPDGRVTSCVLVQSTGNDSLDSATCNIIRRRAKFTPARDSSGNAMADTVVTPPIIWRLEG